VEFNLVTALNLLKEGGGLVLLSFVLWKGIPAVTKALDRNTRMIYHLALKLKVDPDTDILREMERKK
jgi:hypothetical protein